MFFAKRVVVLSAVMSVIAFVAYGYGFEIPIGIFIGGLVSVYKIKSLGNILKLGQSGKISPLTVVLSIMSQTLTFAALAAAAIVDIRLFGGVVAGLLQVVAIICVNAVTEKIGLTHNDWQT